MSPERQRQLAYLLMGLAPLFWAANQVGARYAAPFFPPHQLAFARWFVAFAIMLPFAWRALHAARAHLLTEWREFLLLGALGMYICGAWVYIGAQTTTATNLSLIYAASPVIIIVLSTLIYREAMNVRQSIGAAACMAGILVIIAKGKWDTLAQVSFVVGDLWIAVAATCWALYSVLLKHRPTKLDSFARLTCITAGGLVVLLPFTLYEMATVGPVAIDTRSVMTALVLGIVPGFGAYQAYSYIQKVLPSHIGGLVLYVIPLYTAVVAWLFLGEALRWYHIAGAALILPGVFLATWQRAEQVEGVK